MKSIFQGLYRSTANDLTLACKGMSQFNNSEERPVPDGLLRNGETYDPVVLQLTRTAVEYELRSNLQNVTVGNTEGMQIALHYSNFATAMRTIVTHYLHEHEAFRTIEQIHTLSDGRVYGKGYFKLNKRLATSIVRTWAHQLIDIMQDDEGVDSVSVVHTEECKFSFVPADLRIPRLHALVNKMKVSSQNGELSFEILAHVRFVLIAVVFGSKNLPENCDMMSINFDGTNVTGRIQ